jgi:hypothetical protein
MPTTDQKYIDAGTKHTNPAWRTAALTVVKRLTRRRETLTSADVLDALAKSDVRTHDLRAIGGVMTEARALGYIESAGLVRRSDKHTRGFTTVWRSRHFQPKPTVSVEERAPKSAPTTSTEAATGTTT